MEEYKANTALLWWTIGNELEEQLQPNGNDCLWKRVEWFASHVKKADPNHPVGTVLANAGEGKVQKIRDLCPSLDFLGINVYGNDAHHTHPYTSERGGYPGWGLGVIGSDAVYLLFAQLSLSLTLQPFSKEHNKMAAISQNL